MHHAANNLGAFMSRPGELNGSAKLTRQQVDEIRKLHASGDWPVRKLAKRFGIGKSAIGFIISGKTWK
jgi:hypothetical protein